ncbi:unnamed protein product, partial [Iphiclides podalirius]
MAANAPCAQGTSVVAHTGGFLPGYRLFYVTFPQPPIGGPLGGIVADSFGELANHLSNYGANPYDTGTSFRSDNAVVSRSTIENANVTNRISQFAGRGTVAFKTCINITKVSNGELSIQQSEIYKRSGGRANEQSGVFRMQICRWDHRRLRSRLRFPYARFGFQYRQPTEIDAPRSPIARQMRRVTVPGSDALGVNGCSPLPTLRAGSLGDVEQL